MQLPSRQQAAGGTDPDYSEPCITGGVILNRPGYAGPWLECETTLRNDVCSARRITDLRRFAEEMAEENFVVLRIGTATTRGVGQIVGTSAGCEESGSIPWPFPGWVITVNGMVIPKWASGPGFVITAGLTLLLWREARTRE